MCKFIEKKKESMSRTFDSLRELKANKFHFEHIVGCLTLSIWMHRHTHSVEVKNKKRTTKTRSQNAYRKQIIYNLINTHTHAQTNESLIFLSVQQALSWEMYERSV